MENQYNSEILERVKRPIEDNTHIIPGTTPVIYFGNYDNAKACTISINPSDKEFKNDKGELLENGKARLCSRKMLNVPDNEELSDSQAEEVIKYCNEYFDNNPYRRWFDPFDFFIKQFDEYSYYKNSGYKTCVHLDLVQWATDKWRRLPEDIKYNHLNKDLPILKHLLNKKDFKIIFLNGITVVDNVKKGLDIKLEEKTDKFRKKTLKVYFGKYNEIAVIGWNLVLSHIGGKKDIKELCRIIKEILDKYNFQWKFDGGIK